MKRLFKKDIEDRISKFTDLLTASKRHIAEDTGWHQHLNSPKIGIVATAMAMIYYKALDIECPDKDDCLDFIKSRVREDGGWPYISNANDRSNVESTCWALLTLKAYDPEGSVDMINRGINWILNCIDIDNQDSGWGFSAHSRPRIFITAFALRTLFALNQCNTTQYESGLHWLLNSQKEDGGWGARPEDGSSIYFTSYCISTLLFLRYDPMKPAIRKAHAWLDQRLKEIDIEDPKLVCHMEFIEDGDGANRIRITYFHYIVPFVAMAYMKLGCKNKYLFSCIYTLLQRSVDGVIEHPNLENSRIQPIWALYDTATCLNNFRNIFKPQWKNAFVFCCIFNKIHSYRKLSPLRLITLTSNWMWGIPIIFVTVFCFKWFSDDILIWWNSVENKTLGSFLISLAASALYGLIVWLITFIKKRLT